MPRLPTTNRVWHRYFIHPSPNHDNYVIYLELEDRVTLDELDRSTASQLKPKKEATSSATPQAFGQPKEASAPSQQQQEPVVGATLKPVPNANISVEDDNDDVSDVIFHIALLIIADIQDLDAEINNVVLDNSGIIGDNWEDELNEMLDDD